MRPELSPEFWAICGVGLVLLFALAGIWGQLHKIERHLDRIRENTFDRERVKRESGW